MKVTHQGILDDYSTHNDPRWSGGVDASRLVVPLHTDECILAECRGGFSPS